MGLEVLRDLDKGFVPSVSRPKRSALGRTRSPLRPRLSSADRGTASLARGFRPGNRVPGPAARRVTDAPARSWL